MSDSNANTDSREPIPEESRQRAIDAATDNLLKSEERHREAMAIGARTAAAMERIAAALESVTTVSVKAPMSTFTMPSHLDTNDGCALAAYFRAHPNETSINLYCGCPRCSATCSVTP